MLAAWLLGPAAAIGLNGRLPGLVTGPRDAIVVALYLGVLFGAGVSLTACLASLLVAALAGERIARRARPLSRAAGAAVAVACLAYLTLWWRNANAGFGWTAPVWTGFALAVAVAISLLLGHVVTTAAFAVILARRGGGADRNAPDTARFTSSRSAWSSSWAMHVTAALIAFAGAAALLVVTAPRDAGDRAPVPLAVVSSGLRVRVIAIDGVDPGVIEKLKDEGRIPRLAAVLTGVHARLSLEDAGATRDPARAWTTIATGRIPEDHGVRGLETRRLAGVQGSVTASEPSRLGRAVRAASDLLRLTRPAIASGTERRVKTMWEVASDAGLRTAVVNWWATWPVSSDTDGEIVVSDRATLRLERGGTLDAEIAPASLYDTLRARWAALRTEAVAHARAASASLAWGDPETRAVLERSAELDAIQLALIREVSRPLPDLSAVYLPGLDIAQNTLLGGRDTALAASVVTERLQALRDYYVYLDRLLAGDLSPAAGEAVVVVTEPGRVTAAADGLIGIMGGIAGPARTLPGRVTDVAPTVLHALGLPLSRELAGTPLTGLFRDDFARRYPVRAVATYGRPSPRHTGTGQPLDEEMIDRLRSLGYVK